MEHMLRGIETILQPSLEDEIRLLISIVARLSNA